MIKGEIQFFLYGSVVLGSINRILEIHPNLTPNEAREITIFLRENLKEIFSFAFRLKEIFRKIQNAKADGYLFEGHTWNLQGNIFKIPYYKSKEERRRFSIDKLNASNRFVIDRLTWDLDKAKSLRAFQPMLFHSIDARVNVELRLRLKEKFNICVPSVHDSFAVPIDLIDLVKYEYKQVMFEEVLDKDLEDLFIFSKKVPTKIIEDFKGLNSEIRIRKKNAIFSDMRGHVGG